MCVNRASGDWEWYLLYISFDGLVTARKCSQCAMAHDTAGHTNSQTASIIARRS